MLTDLDGDCMPIGVSLRRLTDVHLDKLKGLSRRYMPRHGMP